MLLCIVVIRSRTCRQEPEGPRADLLERQLDDVSLGDTRAVDHRDHRTERPLIELERQGDAIELEDDAGLMHFGRKLVGEVGDQILGQPGVDLLVGEDRLPRGSVGQIVRSCKLCVTKCLALIYALFGAG